MNFTNYQIEMYLEKKLERKLMEYSLILDNMLMSKNKINENVEIEKYYVLKNEIHLLIEIISDIGFERILLKFDIIPKEKKKP